MPEQVYDPNYDVFVTPSGDGSGSDQSDGSLKGLIDSSSNSTESDRDSNWFSDLFRNIKNWFSSHTGWFKSNGYSIPESSVDKYYKTANAVAGAVNGAPGSGVANILLKNTGTEPGRIIDSLDKADKAQQSFNDNKYTSQFNNELDRLLNNWYTRYQQDSKKAEEERRQYNEKQVNAYRDWLSNFSVQDMRNRYNALMELGINPLLAIGQLSGGSIPSSGYSTGSPYDVSDSGFGSLLSGYSNILGQNKRAGTDMLKILVSLLGLLAS